MKKQSGKTAFVLWGATDLGPPHFSSDILWRTGFKAPDPFFFIEILGEEEKGTLDRTYLFVSSLELERAIKESNVDEVVNMRMHQNKVRKPISNFLLRKGVSKVIVPSSFPANLYLLLSKHFEVVLADETFYPARAVKTAGEVVEIEKAQRAVEKAVGRAIEYLRLCVVAGEVIKDYGVPEFGIPALIVTSEMVRRVIDSSLFSDGYLGVDTIVSGGLQSADPHCMGSGPLLPHMPIVMDVFPLSLKTHYYADMTRTVFKGEPSQALRNMYENVRYAQETGINMVRPGKDGKEIYDWTMNYFTANNFPTEMKNRPMEGFIHGVGHGVGLDIHEPPWISNGKCILENGNIVTVEPGLYYQNARDNIPAGGIRIEDMVLVAKNGCRNLTQFPKDLDSIIIP